MLTRPARHGDVDRDGHFRRDREVDPDRHGGGGECSDGVVRGACAGSTGLTAVVDGSARPIRMGTIASYAWYFGDHTAVVSGATGTASHTDAPWASTRPRRLSRTIGCEYLDRRHCHGCGTDVLPTASFTAKATKLSVAFDGSALLIRTARSGMTAGTSRQQRRGSGCGGDDLACLRGRHVHGHVDRDGQFRCDREVDADRHGGGGECASDGVLHGQGDELECGVRRVGFC